MAPSAIRTPNSRICCCTEYAISPYTPRKLYQAIIDQARQDAENVRRELVARAEADATAIREKANEDTQLAVDRARVDLNRQVASMSVELAGKIVERNLDQSTQQQLIDSYIASVGSN